MQRHLLGSLILALAALTLGACGPNPGGKVPVSSPVYAFQAPDAEDFAPDTDDDDSSDTDGDADGADSADGGE
jgi:hypothetical protein